MENNRKEYNYVIFAVILSLGFIIGAIIMSGTWKKVAGSNVTINVTGSASKQIKSDLGVWTGTFAYESASMTEAYSKLKESADKVKKYLLAAGFPEDKVVFSSISTNTVNNNPFDAYSDMPGKRKPGDNKPTYRLIQSVTIETPDVDRIESLSRSVTELINQGVEIESGTPKFIYTKLQDLKIEMIGLASQDAKTRAEQIAKATGNSVGEVRSSKTGVIQVNAKNSFEVSDYGFNDVSSLEKTITSVVNVSFAIE